MPPQGPAVPPADNAHWGDISHVPVGHRTALPCGRVQTLSFQPATLLLRDAGTSVNLTRTGRALQTAAARSRGKLTATHAPEDPTAVPSQGGHHCTKMGGKVTERTRQERTHHAICGVRKDGKRAPGGLSC